MMQQSIGILDLGLGNLRSVSNAFYELGFDPEIVGDAKAFDRFSHLVLPGVGHFQAAARGVEKGDLRSELGGYVASGRPLLGLCLGMQFLAEEGTEGGPCPGLSFVPGKIERIPDGSGLRIPHIGWNSVRFLRQHPVMEGVKDERDFYFVHSYTFRPGRPETLIAVTDYGEDLAAIVGSGNVVGFQFHPEKSQKNGLKLLENFANWDGQC